MVQFQHNGKVEAMKRLFLLIILLAGCTTQTPVRPTPEATALPPTAAPARPSDTPVPSVPPPAETATTAPPDTPAPATDTPMPEPTTGLPDTIYPAPYGWHLVVDGLERPTTLAVPGDGSGRLFVTEQPGRIRVIAGETLRDEPFLDIVARVGSRGNEQGLLGLAFAPDFAASGQFYVNYTDRQGDTVIARYHADGERADPNSEEVLLHVDQPYANHNGGQLAFGPDGYLYIGLGDGGSGGDPQGHGQGLDTLLGKILRIDVSGGGDYRAPPDNPFVNDSRARPEIWAYGLRNPWRFSFDRATNDLYIADVGQDTWEEIDVAPAGSRGGENYGWNYREGAHPFEGRPPAGLTLIDPITEYNHNEGGCSVTGGYVYRGAQLPSLRGVYFYGDYCLGYVWGLWRDAAGQWRNQRLFETGFNISSFGEDENGELFLLDLNGAMYQLGGQS
jgi:glucose/arabinose dehydrogenase